MKRRQRYQIVQCGVVVSQHRFRDVAARAWLALPEGDRLEARIMDMLGAQPGAPGHDMTAEIRAEHDPE